MTFIPPRNEAKSCLKVLFHLLKIRSSKGIKLDDLFKTKEVDISNYKVIYPVPIEGYYWITPRTRDKRTFLVKPDTLIVARHFLKEKSVDLNFDFKGRDTVVTVTERDFNIALARMKHIQYVGGLGDVVKQITAKHRQKKNK